MPKGRHLRALKQDMGQARPSISPQKRLSLPFKRRVCGRVVSAKQGKMDCTVTTSHVVHSFSVVTAFMTVPCPNHDNETWKHTLGEGLFPPTLLTLLCLPVRCPILDQAQQMLRAIHTKAADGWATKLKRRGP